MDRLCAALAVPFVLSASAAGAQVSRSTIVPTVQAYLGVLPARTGLRDFRMPSGEWREGRRPARNSYIATLPVADNLRIGLGRYAVPELAGRRSNMEAERRPTDMRRRDRAIAAIGVSFGF